MNILFRTLGGLALAAAFAACSSGGGAIVKCASATPVL